MISAQCFECQCEEIQLSAGKRRELKFFLYKVTLVPTMKKRKRSSLSSATKTNFTVGGQAKKSRFSKPGSSGSMSDCWSSDLEQKHCMSAAMEKLHTAKVETFSELERFVCWEADASVRGISKRKSGGKYNSAVYYQVSQGKNVKFQAHKLALCDKIGVLYTELESTGNDCSHLCHNRHCWRPSHLCAEPHQDNMSRNSGVGCGGFVYDKARHRLYCLCRHVPKCEFVRLLSDEYEEAFINKAPGE